MAHRTAGLARRPWLSLVRSASTRVQNFGSTSASSAIAGGGASVGKGSAPSQARLYCTASSSPPIAATPLKTEWASPSEDDIHVPAKSADDGVIEFSSLPLNERVMQSLKRMGCETTFEIQGKTIPLTLNGRDVIGRAVTGSGKTLAFALPIVQILSQSAPTRQPRALVITPTRELCKQVFTCIRDLDSRLKCVSLYGGTSYQPQEEALSSGVDVVVATPGRLNDHLERRRMTLENMKFLVLDEADELLTPNFKVQIENILRDCPKDKQMMLFSATMPPDIQSITRNYMRNAEMVDLVTSRSLIPEGIVHEKLQVKTYQKASVVPDLLLSHQPKRSLIFTQTKVQTHTVASKLGGLGFKAAALNSDMSQNSREAVIQSFREGTVDVLVATDVAARGLDIPDIDLVIQIGIPPNGVDFYIHRSGRTGRKGQAGKTILVYSNRDMNVDRFMSDLRYNKIKLKPIDIPSRKGVTELILKNAVKKLNPELIQKEAMDLARAHAQLLMEEHGSEALTAALVSLTNLESRLDSASEYPEERRERRDRRGAPWERRQNRSRWDERAPWEERRGSRGGGAYGSQGRSYRGKDNWRSGSGRSSNRRSFNDDWGSEDDFQGGSSEGAWEGEEFGAYDDQSRYGRAQQRKNDYWKQDRDQEPFDWK